MKKSINLFQCVTILVACIGQIAVFIAPTSILRYSGSVGVSLILWCTGGLINLCLALCFTEMAAMIPKAGGPYTYVYQTFGPMPGFIIMWGYMLLIVAPAWALNGYTASLYILKPFYPTCQPPEGGIKFMGAWILMSMVAVNCLYMKYITRVQSFLSATKLVAMVLISIGGAVRLIQGDTENLQDAFSGTIDDPGSISLAFFASLFAYGGWQVITNLMEEIKQPERNIPKAIYISFTIVIMIIVPTNVAYFALIPKSEMLESDAVAVLFSERLFSPLTPFMSILVGLTGLGVLNAAIMGHSRVLYAAGRNGQMPMVMGALSKRFNTPAPAIASVCLVALILLVSGTVDSYIIRISLYSSIMSACVLVALLYLRWKEPERHRPYKVALWLPISQILLIIAILSLGLYKKPLEFGTSILIMLAGIPAYWFGISWKKKPKWFTEMLDGITSKCTILFGLEMPSKPPITK